MAETLGSLLKRGIGTKYNPMGRLRTMNRGRLNTIQKVYILDSSLEKGITNQVMASWEPIHVEKLACLLDLLTYKRIGPKFGPCETLPKPESIWL
jgi:hypothetical protein